LNFGYRARQAPLGGRPPAGACVGRRLDLVNAIKQLVVAAGWAPRSIALRVVPRSLPWPFCLRHNSLHSTSFRCRRISKKPTGAQNSSTAHAQQLGVFELSAEKLDRNRERPQRRSHAVGLGGLLLAGGGRSLRGDRGPGSSGGATTRAAVRAPICAGAPSAQGGGPAVRGCQGRCVAKLAPTGVFRRSRRDAARPAT